MSNEESDINLKQLSPESAMPPPKPRSGRKARPNKRGNKGRLSARRIGPNMKNDYEAYKAAKLKQEAMKNGSGSNSAMKPVPVPKKGSNLNRKVGPSNGLGGTLPRVQELGSNNPRRSSSRYGLQGTSGLRGVRSRTSSNTSNQSSGLNDSSQNFFQRELIIRYGDLFKKGVVTNQWKNRFFVLTDKHLYYYLESFDVPQEYHQIEISPKGQISLDVVEKVVKDKKTDNTFQITTPTRVYRLRIEAEGEAARYGVSAWVASITGAIENEKQQHHQQNGVNTSRASFSSLKVDEVDEKNSNVGAYKHPAKRLIDAEMYGKPRSGGPHKPAAIDEYEEWTPFDVAAWLYTVHMQQYSEEFYQQQVDGKALKNLNTGEDATRLGVQEEDLEAFLESVQTLKDIKEVKDMPLS